MVFSQHLNNSAHFLCLTTLISLLVLLDYAPNRVQAVPLIPNDATAFQVKRYCSETLSDAIRLICGGNYNSLGRKFPDSIGSGSFRSNRAVLKRLSGNDEDYFYRPLTIGPIHECCRRPCGYSELKMYCAPD